MYRLTYDCKRPLTDAESASFLLKFKAYLHSCSEWSPRHREATLTHCGSADLTLLDVPRMLQATAYPPGLAEASELDWLRDWLLERPGVLSAAARTAGVHDSGNLLVVRCVHIAPEQRGKGLGLEFLRRVIAAWLPAPGAALLVADSLLHNARDPARGAAIQRLVAHYATMGFAPLESGARGAPAGGVSVPMIWVPQLSSEANRRKPDAGMTRQHR